ncbi:hypothetical protein RFI_22680 [Reticulomyxa filosa]|uniref:Uncharacterized protein n=1 Tax=Reticulomyxa filosa TaxID=46433 RepID=X6MKZ6_RETFI|nr:hypothetical protein RFI_22680 [Reticulomyxa filosa]|eukprot:ETO14688.1 hypothetical protein RFI_22680 [Reticulomyxa filosa]
MRTNFDQSIRNGDHNRLLKKLGAILTSIWNKSKHNTNVTKEYSKISTLKRGQPNLFIFKDNGQLNIVINLFQSLAMLPRVENVLICKETTTEEEVKCTLVRALYCAQLRKQDCLYCLVWPEKLRMVVLIKVVQCFQELFLSPSKSICNFSYLFVVVSSDEHNDLTRVLQRLQSNTRASFHYILDISQNLYCNSLSTFLTYNNKPKPFVQLYRSDIVVGKYDIPRLNAKQEYVKYSDQDCIIVYHLDVSSCVNRKINDLLFQLFFLRHIDTHSSSFHVNPNMVFFVELPSKFDDVQALYTLFSGINFPLVSVDKASNPFLYEEKDQYCLKWMKEYYSDNLKFGVIIDIYVCIHTITHNLKKLVYTRKKYSRKKLGKLAVDTNIPSK